MSNVSKEEPHSVLQRIPAEQAFLRTAINKEADFGKTNSGTCYFETLSTGGDL